MVRNYVRKRVHQERWTEEQLRLAIESVKKGCGVSTSAKKYGIPRSTLQNKITYGLKSSPDKSFRKAFAKDEEDLLAKYLKALEERLFVFTRTDVRRLAYQFAERYRPDHPFNKKEELAGQDWLNNFIKRHSELSIKKAEKISGPETLQMNEGAVSDFFTVFNSAMEQYNFPASKIFNADEASITIASKKLPVTTISDCVKQADIPTASEAGDTVTVQVCFSASGEYMPMMIVFPHIEVEDTFLLNAPVGTWAEAHSSGCIQHDIFYRWLKKFIQFSGSSKDNPVLLILNGHANYIKCFEVTDLAEENGVVIICVSAIIKHEIQPIDLTFAKPFSDNYINEVRQWLQINSPKVVTIYQIAELLGNAFVKTATHNIAVTGFSKAGIGPFNTEIVYPSNAHFMAEAFGSNAYQNQTENNGSESISNTVREPIVNIKREMLEYEKRQSLSEQSKRMNTFQNKEVADDSDNDLDFCPGKKPPKKGKRQILKIKPTWKKRKLPERVQKTKNFLEREKNSMEADFIDDTEAEPIPAKGEAIQPLSIKLKKQSGKRSNSKSAEEYDLTEGQLYLLKNNKLIPVTLDVILRAVK